jgi:hypothetical protein
MIMLNLMKKIIRFFKKIITKPVRFLKKIYRVVRYTFRLARRIWRYLPRLKQPWGGVYIDRWILSSLRYRMQYWVETINRELAGIFRDLLTNIVHFLVMLIILVLAVMLQLMAVDTTVQILNSLSLTLLGLVTLFITAAIFMATQAASAIGKSNDDKRQFSNTINNYSGSIYEIFERGVEKYTVDEVYTLLYGIAAFHIIDQPSYIVYREWLLKIAPSLPTDNQSWRTPLSRTYEIAQIGQNSREWNILPVLEIISKYKLANKKEGAELKKIRSSALSFQATGSQSYWEHYPFMGARLTRVVYVSLFSLVLSFIFSNVVLNKPNMVSQYNFYTTDISRFVVVLFMLISIVVSLRYLILLVEYFRSTSNRSYQDAVNFYPENPSEGSYYQYYRVR